MNGIFLELTLVLVMTGVIAVLVSLFRQPSIIAYIATGLVLGPLGYYHLRQEHAFEALGQIGITLLLFMVGLELDLGHLRKLGKQALAAGLAQVAITSGLGYLLGRSLGFSHVGSLFMAPAMTFSSTIIAIKLLNEKKDTQSLYGKLVVGIFLTQDLVAILILIGLATLVPTAGSLYSGLPFWQNLLFVAVRALLLGLGVAWASRSLFPKVLKRIGKSDELLLVFSLAWALGLAAFVSLPFMGFTLEIGGFLAGLALAGSAVHYEISARIKSLRDFFIMIFFIVLGSNLVFSGGSSLSVQAAALALFVLIGKPVIVMLLLGMQGFKPRTGFLTGVTVGQISEFSLILAALGRSLGLLSPSEVGLVALVGIITFSLSSYTILQASDIYRALQNYLKVFDFRKGAAERGLHDISLKGHVILVGAHRMGHHLIASLKGQRRPFVVVDFNPEIVEKCLERGIPAICGDISDPYIQDQVRLPAARLVVSTVPDHDDNLALAAAVRSQTAGRRLRPKLIFLAQDEEEIKSLYGQDIDYVVSPHFMGGLHLAKILEDDREFKSLRRLKENHLKIIGPG